jgi:4-amino-4-deoxy-L-arabinose transferase-like glycosyltransferase
MATDFWQRKSTLVGAYVFLGLVALIMFVIRLESPSNLMDGDQERPASYVLDALQNGNWLCQRDVTGDITSKPPLYTWLAALASLSFGRLNLVTLYLPAVLATLALAWLILSIGRKHFGLAAGFFGALTYLLSFVCIKQIALARTDGLFSLTVAIAALLAYGAWTSGRGWTWFWIAAAAATLTKGPLGLVLGAGGLLAAFWEQRSGHSAPLKGSHWLGVALFVLIAGGWFGLSYAQWGQALVDKMFKQELVAQVVSNGRGLHTGAGFYKPSLYFLSRFAPWSLLACIGFWRVWRRPSSEPMQRRFERFLFCWFFVGLFLFSCSPHQRGDLLWPLIPAAALLGGREFARMIAARPPAVVAWTTTGMTAVILTLWVPYFQRVGRTNVYVLRTRGIEQLADAIREQVGEQFPLTHVDDPFALQFYLGVMRQTVRFERAAQLLKGDAAAFVVVRNVARLESLMGPNPPVLHELARWPATGEAFVSIVSNHPQLEWTKHMALLDGSLRIQMEDARMVHASEYDLGFRSAGNHSAVMVTNESDQPRKIRVRLIQDTSETVDERVLTKGETLDVRP